MDNILISIIEKPNEPTLNQFKKFSGENWGDIEESTTELDNNYFDTPKFVVTASLENELVGIQLVFLREITYKDVKIQLAGLGGLVAHKNHRHKGIATTLLKATLKYLTNKNIDVAMLCTDIETLGHIYTQVGFVPLDRPYYFLDKNGKEIAEDAGMITNVSNKSAFDLVVSTYDKLSIGPSNF